MSNISLSANESFRNVIRWRTFDITKKCKQIQINTQFINTTFICRNIRNELHSSLRPTNHSAPTNARSPKITGNPYQLVPPFFLRCCSVEPLPLPGSEYIPWKNTHLRFLMVALRCSPFKPVTSLQSNFSCACSRNCILYMFPPWKKYVAKFVPHLNIYHKTLSAVGPTSALNVYICIGSYRVLKDLCLTVNTFTHIWKPQREMRWGRRILFTVLNPSNVSNTLLCVYIRCKRREQTRGKPWRPKRPNIISR